MCLKHGSNGLSSESSKRTKGYFFKSLSTKARLRGRFQNFCNRRIGRSLFSTSSHIGKFQRSRAPRDFLPGASAPSPSGGSTVFGI